MSHSADTRVSRRLMCSTANISRVPIILYKTPFFLTQEEPMYISLCRRWLTCSLQTANVRYNLYEECVGSVYKFSRYSVTSVSMISTTPRFHNSLGFLIPNTLRLNLKLKFTCYCINVGYLVQIHGDILL